MTNNISGIKFMVQAVYDVLPSPANLHTWGKSDLPTCPLWGNTRTHPEQLPSSPQRRSVPLVPQPGTEDSGRDHLHCTGQQQTLLQPEGSTFHTSWSETTSTANTSSQSSLIDINCEDQRCWDGVGVWSVTDDVSQCITRFIYTRAGNKTCLETCWVSL